MNFLIVSEDADKDLDEQFDYIAQDNIDAALQLYDAAQETFKILAQIPGMGSERHYKKIKNIRMYPVIGFKKHLIFYRRLEGGIKILRVISASQNIESIFS